MKKVFLSILMMGSFAVFAQVESSDQTLNDTTSSTQSTNLQQDTTGMQQGTDLQQDTTDTSRQEFPSQDQAGVGQEDTAGISDEDLRKYAVIMDSVNAMKQSLIGEIGDMVKNNEKMTNSRYNELAKAGGDEAKLKEMKATDEEIAFVKQVNDRKTEGASEISETFQTLARDYIGAETYNEIKEALATDTELKARYDAILSEVQNGERASTH